MATGSVQSAAIEVITATVTPNENGEINLISIIGSDRIPIYVQGTTGYIVNGTNADEYLPYIFGDQRPGISKTIRVYCLKR
jgi:hypothetical protein